MNLRSILHSTLVIAVIGVPGCASAVGERAGNTPFLIRSAAPEGLGEISLTALLRGRIVNSNGCFVLRSEGEDRAVVFGPRFSLDRERGEIRNDATSQTVKLGVLSSFGGGETSSREVTANGPAIPTQCPKKWVRIDDMARGQR